MQTVTLAEAKAQLSRLIELVEAGEEVTITKRGRPVVRLIPTTSPARQQLPSLAELRARLPEQNESAGDFIRRLRDSDRY
jgi:prevent-host-death family protein